MIEFFVDRKRTALAFLLVLIVAGIFGRINIPVEAEPDITIPVVYAGVGLPGVSPSDSERLLVRPLEEDLIGIELISLSSSNKPGTSTENCPCPVSISPAMTA